MTTQSRRSRNRTLRLKKKKWWRLNEKRLAFARAQAKGPVLAIYTGPKPSLEKEAPIEQLAGWVPVNIEWFRGKAF